MVVSEGVPVTTQSVGDECVLSALAATLPELRSVDLPRTVVSSEAAVVPVIAVADHHTRRYVELGELGRGGLGVVLEVFDQDLRRAVALKRLHHARPDARDVALVVREAQVQAQLEHPNVPAVHSLGVDAEGRAFFTMTRLHGSSLAELLAQRSTDPAARDQLTLPRLLRIAMQVGYALAFAHARGVVHRDVKPANVVIGDFGEVRLMDWGIAKVVVAPDEAASPASARAGTVALIAVDRGATVEGGFVGTPGYAAPEQAMGQRDVDARADVYALGATLYEMLGGRPPIDGDSLDEVVAAGVDGRITPLERLAPVPRSLAAVVHKALAARRDDRYSSMQAFLEDLEAVLEGRRISALTEGVARRFWRFYGGRGPRAARLRTRDLDCLGWGSYLAGIGTGVALVVYGLPSAGTIGWVAFVAGLLVLVPPIYTLARKARPDDPGSLVAFADTARVAARGTRSTPGGTRRAASSPRATHGIGEATTVAAAPTDEEGSVGQAPTLGAPTDGEPPAA